MGVRVVTVGDCRAIADVGNALGVGKGELAGVRVAGVCACVCACGAMLYPPSGTFTGNLVAAEATEAPAQTNSRSPRDVWPVGRGFRGN